MTKILISWKGINARISADPKEAIKQISSLTQMAQEDLKSGKLKDWASLLEAARDTRFLRETRLT